MELRLEACPVVSAIDFLPANFSLPTSDPFEGPAGPCWRGGVGGRVREEGALEGGGEAGCRYWKQKRGEHTFHGMNAETEKGIHWHSN